MFSLRAGAVVLQGEADRRIKQCNEVLQSMKLIKLYAWERIFCASIRATRAAEIRQLLRAAGCRIVARAYRRHGNVAFGIAQESSCVGCCEAAKELRFAAVLKCLTFAQGSEALFVLGVVCSLFR